MIEVRGLSHSFGDRPVLSNINLTVGESEILGLIGVNGSGKSTFLRLISGVLTPECGEVLYDGKAVSLGVAREELFFLPDDPFYDFGTSSDDLFKLYKTFYPHIDEATYVEMMGYAGLSRRKALSSFSKGMRRQAFIALAFAIAPKYLLLDEAFDGLDPLARERFKKKVRDVAKRGSVVIISSHALKELEGFCDNYLVLNGAQLIPPEQMSQKMSNMLKYQIAFETEPSIAWFTDLKMHHFEKKGRIATILVEGEEEQVRAELEELHPLIIDRLEIAPGENLLSAMEELAGGGDRR